MASGRTQDNTIDIIPFQPRFQKEVVQLFRDGYSSETYNLGPIVERQSLYLVNRKLSQDGGDMYNIWDSYMKCDSNDDGSSAPKCKHFWVAIDRQRQIVVGHVGVNMSSYGEDDKFIYHKQELNPSNVCELVRLSVHKDYRGKNLGKRLCSKVQKYARDKGMKQIVANTLNKMNLARRLYENCGFKLVSESKLPPALVLEPDKWNEQEFYTVHYVKLL